MDDVFRFSDLRNAVQRLKAADVPQFRPYTIYVTRGQAEQIAKAMFQAEEDHKLALWLRGRPYRDFDLGLATMRHERRREDRRARGPVTAAEVITRVQKLGR